MNTSQQDYTKKVEKSITDWESVKTTNKLLDTIARHLAVIADKMISADMANDDDKPKFT